MNKMNFNKSLVLMAVASGKESKAFVNTLYQGIGVFHILGVNPNVEELKEFFDRDFEEPEYIGTTEVGDDKTEVPQIRLDFVIQTDPDQNNGIEWRTRESLYLAKHYRYNTAKDKVQVVNKYGEFTWLSLEHVKNGTTPENMSWYDASDIRPAFVGEEDLTGLLRAYLNIPNKSFTNQKTKEVKFIDNLDDALLRLDNISSYFEGDISEIKDVLSYQPNNRFKQPIGVKTHEGNQYPAFFRQFYKLSYNNPSKVEIAIKEKQDNGSYPNIEFSVKPLHKYEVNKTDFSEAPQDTPWGNGAPKVEWNTNK